MTEISAQIVPRHDLSITDIDSLEDKLYDYNRQATGSDDGRGLAYVATDMNGLQIGAIAGYSWAGMAEIKQLWVDESYRGQGLGRRLLEAAIAEATVRRCQSMWLMSHDFQAPGFYERYGFYRAAELRDWPPGYTHVILRLLLRADG
jgi:ribosomal protein S18 acetylase RimI-like enzyme